MFPLQKQDSKEVDNLKEEIVKLQAKQLYVFSTLFCCPLTIIWDNSRPYFVFIHDSVSYRMLLGHDLTGLSLKELQHLEQQLNEGLLCVKEKKVFSIFLLISFACPSSII